MSLHLSDRYTRAIAWTVQLHAAQTRKGGDVRYIGHLLGVSSIVIEHGGTEDEAIAALLHDAVEDQGGAKTRAEIKIQFGKPVAEIVDGCTDDDPAPGQPKRPWKERKVAYIAHVQQETNPSILLVSAADKLHNARAILDDYRALGEGLWPRFNASRDDILWYYESLIAAFAESGARLSSGHPAAIDQLEKLCSKLSVAIGEIRRLADQTAAMGKPVRRSDASPVS